MHVGRNFSRLPDAVASASREPLVSIITPFYNVEAYLDEAVTSVMDQSYGNWELILIDDGSTDGSGDAARGYAESSPGRIVYLEHENHENKGTSASRNAGLAVAKGELITFLDADDVWLPGKLGHQVELIQRFPRAAMVCGASHYWGSWTGDHERDRIVPVGCQANRLYEPPALMKLLYPLGRGDAPSMNGLLVRKGAIEASGGFLDAFTGMYDDQVFLTRLYLEHPVYVTDCVYDKYRLRPGSICDNSRRNKDYNVPRLQYLRWLKTHLPAAGIRDRELNSLVRTALLKYESPVRWRYLRKFRKIKGKIGSRLKRFFSGRISSGQSSD